MRAESCAVVRASAEVAQVLFADVVWWAGVCSTKPLCYKFRNKCAVKSLDKLWANTARRHHIHLAFDFGCCLFRNLLQLPTFCCAIRHGVTMHGVPDAQSRQWWGTEAGNHHAWEGQMWVLWPQLVRPSGPTVFIFKEKVTMLPNGSSEGCMTYNAPELLLILRVREPLGGNYFSLAVVSSALLQALQAMPLLLSLLILYVYSSAQWTKFSPLWWRYECVA